MKIDPLCPTGRTAMPALPSDWHYCLIANKANKSAASKLGSLQYYTAVAQANWLAPSKWVCSNIPHDITMNQNIVWAYTILCSWPEIHWGQLGIVGNHKQGSYYSNTKQVCSLAKNQFFDNCLLRPPTMNSLKFSITDELSKGSLYEENACGMTDLLNISAILTNWPPGDIEII